MTAIIHWEHYPSVLDHELARSWLQIQSHLQLAPKTIDAYGRNLHDFLSFCDGQGILPETITHEQVALYVHDLAQRPNPKGRAILSIQSGIGLSNATIQQRLTVVRLFSDYLIEQQIRSTNPVGRGVYVPGKGFAGVRDRGLVPRYKRLPWIPSDEQWQALLQALKTESLRNQLMFLLAYDGALRREELVTVCLEDFDFAHQQVTLRAERTKNRKERVIGYGLVTNRLLAAYLPIRRQLSALYGPLFLSESKRNRGTPLSLVMWSKIVAHLARSAGIPQFTTHTARHLRLTHLARAKLDLHQIALYAGHRSLETTMRYIHLSGVELAVAVAKSLSGFERYLEILLEGISQ